jgi:hypothetical protein
MIGELVTCRIQFTNSPIHQLTNKDELVAIGNRRDCDVDW